MPGTKLTDQVAWPSKNAQVGYGPYRYGRRSFTFEDNKMGEFSFRKSHMGKVVSMAEALAMDAFGNGTANNLERSMRYIAVQLKLLKALGHYMENRNDVKAKQALDELCTSIGREEHPDFKKFPPFSGELVQSSTELREKVADIADDVLITVKP